MGGSVLGWLLCGLITLVCVLLRRKSRGDERYPPGPRGWPLLGHVYLFLELPHQALARVSKKYGPVLGLRLGQLRAVVACSPEAAREVLLTHDKLLAHRPPLKFTSIAEFGAQNGILFSSHDPWRLHRKLGTLNLFTAKRLQDLHHVRQQELRTLLLSIHRRSGGAPIDIGSFLTQMSCRLIMRLVHSEASEYVGGVYIPQLVKDEEHSVAPIIGDLFPCLSFLDFLSKKPLLHIHERLEKVYTHMLTERKQSTSSYDDLLQGLLSQEDTLTLDEIKSILHDVVVAGIHTTGLTLEWAMAEMLKHPHCFRRLQKEIDMHVGEKREVSEADVPNLSYLKCIVKEVFRLHPAAPLLLPHTSSEDFKLQGYVIPANTIVFVNVWAIARDERVWPNANEFIPERFEGKDVDLKGQSFELLPFGSGRRICLGMPLALPVVEVTLANLVSCFDWELPEGETHASLNMDEKRGVAANKATPVMAVPKPRISISELSKV